MKTENEVVANGFLKTLGWLNRGSIVAELSDAQDRLVSAVKETGKKGKITFVIEIAPVGKGPEDQVTVTASVSEQMPKHSKSPNVFFIEGDSKLSRNPVNQLELFNEIDGGSRDESIDFNQSTVNK